eukprot:1530749-Pyramimonas_sp.AAC.1
MTERYEQLCGPSSSSRPISDLCMRKADAPDVSESVSKITATARVKHRKPTAPLKMTRTIRIASRT